MRLLLLFLFISSLVKAFSQDQSHPEYHNVWKLDVAYVDSVRITDTMFTDLKMVMLPEQIFYYFLKDSGYKAKWEYLVSSHEIVIRNPSNEHIITTFKVMYIDANHLVLTSLYAIKEEPSNSVLIEYRLVPDLSVSFQELLSQE